MERRVVDSLVAPKRLAYFLTFVSPSFMALHRIIIDISESMSRREQCNPPGNPMHHILQKKSAWNCSLMYYSGS